MDMKIIIIAHNHLKLVQHEIEILHMFHGVDKADMVGVNNASENSFWKWAKVKKESIKNAEREKNCFYSMCE